MVNDWVLLKKKINLNSKIYLEINTFMVRYQIVWFFCNGNYCKFTNWNLLITIITHFLLIEIIYL